MTKTLKVTVLAAVAIAVIGGVSLNNIVKAENAKIEAAEQAAIALQQEQEEQARIEAEEMAIAKAKAEAEAAEIEKARVIEAEAARIEAAEQLVLATHEEEAVEEVVEEEIAVTVEEVKTEAPAAAEAVKTEQPKAAVKNPTGSKQYKASEITQDMLPSGIKWGGDGRKEGGGHAGGADGRG